MAYDPYAAFSLDPTSQLYDRMTQSVSPYWEPTPEPDLGEMLGGLPPLNVTAGNAPGAAQGLANALTPQSVLPEGLAGEPGGRATDVDGSVTSQKSRMTQSTGWTAVANMDPSQSAEHKFNPLDVIQLPFRALGLVDRSLKTALGLKTKGDAADSAAQYLQYGQDQKWQGFDKMAPAPYAAMQRRMSGDTGNPLDFLTGARQQEEQQLIDAARQAQARRREYEQQAQLGTAQANQGYAQTRNAWEPIRQEQDYEKSVNEIGYGQMRNEYQPRLWDSDLASERANRNHLGFLEAGGYRDPVEEEIRRLQLERERLTQPETEGDYRGLTPAQKYTLLRQTESDRRADERLRQNETRIGQTDDRLMLSKRTAAERAGNMATANELLEGTPLEAKPSFLGGLPFLGGSGTSHYDIVPRGDAAEDAPRPPRAASAPTSKRTSSSQPLLPPGLDVLPAGTRILDKKTGRTGTLKVGRPLGPDEEVVQ